jgi:hypothetical protein
MAASFPPYAITNHATVTTLTATDTLGATHGGADVQISVKNLETSLNSIYSGVITIIGQPAANQIFQRDTTSAGNFGLGATSGVAGLGQVSFTLNLTVPAVVLQYRLYAAPGTPNAGAMLQDWTTLASNVNPNATTFTPSVSASLNWYVMAFRANYDNASLVTSGNPFAVGELVAFSGQSLAVCMVSTLCSGDQATIASLASSIAQPVISGVTYINGINPFCSILAAWNASNGGNSSGTLAVNSYNSTAPATQSVNWNSTTTAPGTTWQLPNSAAGGYSLASTNLAGCNSTFAVQFLNRLIKYWGVPCGLVGYAVGSTSLNTWQPGFTYYSNTNVPNCTNYAALEALLALGGGKFRCMLWMQGHNDATGNSTVYTQTAYNSAVYTSIATQGLAPLFAALRLANTYPSALSQMALVLSSIPNYTSQGGATNPTYTPNAVGFVRQAYETYAASVGAPYVDAHDITMYVSGGQIGLHPSQAGCITMADHFFRAYMAACTTQSTALGDGGPKITAASRAFNSNYIGLTVSNPNGGTTLTSVGTIASLFAVYQSGTIAATYANPGGTTIANQASGGYAVNSATIASPGSIILNVAGTFTDGTNPVALDVWFERPFDGTTDLAAAIYDNVTSDGLPNGRLMMAGPLPITAPAPTLTLTVANFSQSSYNPGTAVSVSGTYINGTPSGFTYYFTSSGGNTTVTSVGSYTESAGSYSFTATAPGATGNYTLTVTAAGTSASATTANTMSVLSNSIAVNTIATQTIAAAGTVTSAATITGTWSGYAPTTLDYQTDDLTWPVASSPVITNSGTTGTYSFVLPSGFYAGEYAVSVKDQSTGALGSSNAFAVVNTGTTAGTNVPLPTLSTSSWAPVLHFDASNAAGQFFQGTSSSSPQAINGSKVGFFQDAYGNQYSQSAASQQPQYVVNAKNGMPGLLFTSSNFQFLGAVSNTLASALYANGNNGFGILLVCTFRSGVYAPTGGISQGNVVPLSWGNSGVSINAHLDPLFVAGTTMIFTYGGGPYQNFNMAGSSGLALNNLNKWVARNNIYSTGTYGDYIHWDNGGSIYSENGPYTIPTSQFTSSYNYSMIGASLDTGVGAYGSPNPCNFPFDGWIHEILVYTQPITSADSTALITYATNKWGN